jgi:RND family efflux transporter MFP subunit
LLAAPALAADSPPAAASGVQAYVPPVGTIVAHLQDVPLRASLSGTISARVQQELAFRVGGRVIERDVEVGQHVAKGDVLVRLDQADQKANATLAAASVDAAQAQVTQAQQSFERADQLFKQGLATRAKYEEAQAALDAANASLTAAQSQKSSADELVSYTELKADYAGIIVASNVEIGQVVVAGQSVMSLAVDGPRDAVFDAFGGALTGVPENVPVAVSSLADAKITATGHVREISPTTNAATGTVRVKVALDNETPDLPLGTAVLGAIDLPGVKGFALPWSALFRNEVGAAVWLVDKAGRVELHPVTVERYTDTLVIVTAGLDDGAVVVTSGAQLLRPGELVRTLEASK